MPSDSHLLLRAASLGTIGEEGAGAGLTDDAVHGKLAYLDRT
jgi:hypothetical protein